MSFKNTFLLGALCAALLALAAPAFAQDDGMSPDARKLQEQLQGGDPGSTFFNDQFIALRAYSDTEISAMYRNQTNRYVHPEDGAAVEYTAADGRLFVWHARNAQILEGRWRVDGRTHLCLDYTRRVGNFLNRGQQRGWECRPISVPASIAVETLPGDVLNLAHTHNVPFRLRRDERATLSELSQRIYARSDQTAAREPEPEDSGGYAGDASVPPEAEEDDRPWWRRVIGETPDGERLDDDIYD